MKDEIVLTCIIKELSKIKSISNERIDLIAKAIEERIDQTDSEDIINKKIYDVMFFYKIYDVMFFYFGGSHLKKNPVNIDDYKLLSKSIRLAIEKPEGMIGDLLTQINQIDIDIENKRNELQNLYLSRDKLVNTLQNICSHSKYKESREYHEDEYGSLQYGDLVRTCSCCGLKEKQSDHCRQVKFKIIPKN